VKRVVGNDSGENGVAGAASVWAAATGDRDEAHVANSAEDAARPQNTEQQLVRLSPAVECVMTCCRDDRGRQWDAFDFCELCPLLAHCYAQESATTQGATSRVTDMERTRDKIEAEILKWDRGRAEAVRLYNACAPDEPEMRYILWRWVKVYGGFIDSLRECLSIHLANESVRVDE